MSLGTICIDNLKIFLLFPAPLFINAYRLQFYSSVVPYLVREYKRKNVPNSGIRILHENDPDIRSNLEGEVAIITGGTRGIGIEVVRTFLRKGCHVITTSSSAKAEVISARYNKTIEGIEPGKWKLEIWHLDLMSLKSVMNFVDHFKSKNYTQLNYFIANAGIMFPKYKVSIDGYESQFQTNYLGHVLLTYHFMPYLYHSAKRIGHQSRLVLVSSCLHHIPNRIRFEDLQSVQVYSPHYAYGLSKLAIVMFVYRLSRTFKMKTDWTDQVKPFSLHPGLVDTDLLSTIELLKEYPFLANRIALRVSFPPSHRHLIISSILLF